MWSRILDSLHFFGFIWQCNPPPRGSDGKGRWFDTSSHRCLYWGRRTRHIVWGKRTVGKKQSGWGSQDGVKERGEMRRRGGGEETKENEEKEKEKQVLKVTLNP